MRTPEATPQQHGNDPKPALFAPLEHLRQLDILEEVRRQEVSAYQQERDVRSIESGIDVLSPVVAGLHSISYPEFDSSKAYEDLQMTDELLLQLAVLRAATDQ
jgi:hypothetical protein